LGAGLDTCGDVVDLVGKALQEEPSGEVGEGGVIAEGFSVELDEARNASRNAREIIAGMERAERERTGIRSLKVGYNKVFGYYIEVSKANLRQVPAEYIRRQTLVNGERFITPELKEHESLILNARERVEEMEGDLFRQVCRQVADRGEAIVRLAEAVAHVDVFVSLAEAAARYGYVRPRLTLDGVIEIKDGRHPVVERMVPPGTFVPNDTQLSINGDQLVVLTGPNMSGKSTYIRQVALMVLMAQIGSFVAAGDATIGLVDRVFTRVGLQDDLATGQSTFMVEMVETAGILNRPPSAAW
jgi:DNA mismatch repair protein MutS